MANKKRTPSRRSPRSATPRTFGDGRPVQPDAAVAETELPEVASPSFQPAGSFARPTGAETRRRLATRGTENRPQLPLREEYAYVLADLRRLAILAVSMVVLMVVLGLILH